MSERIDEIKCLLPEGSMVTPADTFPGAYWIINRLDLTTLMDERMLEDTCVETKFIAQEIIKGWVEAMERKAHELREQYGI